jgi:tubulin polyglutamylase TTLL2
VTLTLVSLSQTIPWSPHAQQTTNNCYEFYGFDIMLDSSLKPWLIEVNGPPQLTIDSDIDLKVKHPMIRDMIRILFETTENDVAAHCNSKTQKNKN